MVSKTSPWATRRSSILVSSPYKRVTDGQTQENAAVARSPPISLCCYTTLWKSKIQICS